MLSAGKLAAKPCAGTVRPSRAVVTQVHASSNRSGSRQPTVPAAGLKTTQAALLAAGTILLQNAPALAAETAAVQATTPSLSSAVEAASSTIRNATPPTLPDTSDVDSAIGTVIDVVKAAGQFVKGGISNVQSGVQVLKEGYDAAAPVLQQGYDVVAPVVSDAYSNVRSAAAPLVQQAAPVVSDALGSSVDSVRQGLTQTLQSTGVDLASVKNTVSSVANSALEATTAATPVAFRVINFLIHTDPATLGQYALGGAGVWFLAPQLLKLVFGNTSVGTLSATATLNAVVQDNDTVLVDVRSDKEKDTNGVPDVPSSASARVVEVELASVADKKLRGLLKDPSAIEAQTTAIQIAALKRINKGTKIVILDKNGASATSVARELARRGYNKVYSVMGGFDGRGGWVQSKLQIKPYTSSTSFTAPLLPRIGTRSTIKQLAAPRS